MIRKLASGLMIIMVFVAALSGVSVFAAGNLLDTSGFPEPSFTPPPSHPRLFFQASDIPRILENKTKPENAAALTMHQSNLNLTHTGILPTPSPGTSNHNSTILGYIESWAFEYATMGDAAQGNKAVTAIKNYAQTVQYVNPLSDAYVRQGGYFILTAAKVYDWCYDLLDSNDKSMLIERVETICEEGFDIGWPPLAKGAVSGHSSEAQFLCDVTAAAIAFYDERPDIYHVVFGRFMKEYVPARKYYYPGGWLHQGSLYGTYRGGFDFISTFIWARAGLPMVYGPEQQYLAYYCLYMRRPDGKMFADGDATVSGSGFTAWKNQARLLLPAANYYKDPYLKGETIRQKLYQSMMIGYGANANSPVDILIMNDPDIIPAPLEDLPKTKFFGSPFGHMIARTGWDTMKMNQDSDDVIAVMKLGELHFGNHQHFDAGHFQIYYKGILANDSGRYGRYGTSHDYNYFKRSIAHNVILVHDPDEAMWFANGKASDGISTKVNDGGQRIINNGAEMSRIEDLLTDGYKTGLNIGHDFGPDPITPEYSYVRGDLTDAYSSKIEHYDRAFTFFNLKNSTHPAALIVFDKVRSSNPLFKKTWLLHGLYEPDVNGNRTVFRNESLPNRGNFNGKLTVDTLLPMPENTTITKIPGGDNTFMVNGINYPSDAEVYPDIHQVETDDWRIEVSPNNPSKQDYFLNVLQVGTSTPDTPPLPVDFTESDSAVSVQIADRVMVYSLSDSRTAGNIEFSVTGSGDKKILVEGLADGLWNVICDGIMIGTQPKEAGADSGTLYFTGGAGHYVLSYAGKNSGLPLYIDGSVSYPSPGVAELSAAVYGSASEANIIFAVYDENGALYDISVQEYTEPKNYTYRTELPGTLTSEISAKIFAWKADMITLLAELKEMPLQEPIDVNDLGVTVKYYGGTGCKLVPNMSKNTPRFANNAVTFSYGLPRTKAEADAGLPSQLEGALYFQPVNEFGIVGDDKRGPYNNTESEWIELEFSRSATVYVLAPGPTAAPSNLNFLASGWERISNDNIGSVNTTDGTYYYGANDTGGTLRHGWIVNDDTYATKSRVFLYKKEVHVPPGQTVTLKTYGLGASSNTYYNSAMYSLAIKFKEKEQGNVEIEYYGGNTINIVPNMSRTTKRFADNNCSFNSEDFLPAELEGATYLQTSYSDSQAAPGGKADIYRSDETYASNTIWLAFTIDRSATVYYLTPNSYTGNRGQFWLREWTGGQPGDSVENPSTIFLPGPRPGLSGSFARYWKVNNEGNEARNRVYLAKREYIVPEGEKVLIEIPVMGSLGVEGEKLTTNPYVYSVAIQWKDD